MDPRLKPECPSEVLPGHVVVYVDPTGKEHNALVTANFSGANAEHPCINLTYVTDDENRKDQYGLQLMREATSVSHDNPPSTAHGRYWKLPV